MMFRFTAVAVVLCVTEAANFKATFPSPSKRVFPRLRLDSTLPNLPELTFCSWIKVHTLNGSSLAPVLSYSTLRNNNEFLILFFIKDGKLTPRVYRGTKEVNNECEKSCQIGSWCHICVSWFGANGRFNTYINGRKCKEGTLNFNEPHLPSGGVLVIGQEQDGLDESYDVNQAFIGDITDFHLWDEVLSDEQIEEAGVCRGKRKEGNVVSWLKSPMVAQDGVVFSSTQLCLP